MDWCATAKLDCTVAHLLNCRCAHTFFSQILAKKVCGGLASFFGWCKRDEYQAEFAVSFGDS